MPQYGEISASTPRLERFTCKVCVEDACLSFAVSRGAAIALLALGTAGVAYMAARTATQRPLYKPRMRQARRVY